MRVLVVGAGSIGQRHIKNLLELGHDIGVVDPDIEKLRMIARAYPKIPTHPARTIDSSFIAFEWDAALVCVPTYFHMQTAYEIAIQHAIPIMIEKPLSHTLDKIGEFQTLRAAQDSWACVGYSMRFHPAIQKMKELLDDDAVGQPLYVRAEVGQYLPDWHPSKSIQGWWMTKKELGGGALLDLSHEIDYLRWFFGEVREFNGITERVTDLTVNADDYAELGIAFENGPIASVHMDILDRQYNRRCRIVGIKGTIAWDHQYKFVECNGIRYPYSEDWNLQYVEEIKEFLRAVETGDCSRLVSVEDAAETLRIVLEVRNDSAT